MWGPDHGRRVREEERGNGDDDDDDVSHDLSSSVSAQKMHKVEEEPHDTDFPQTRRVILRFASSGMEVSGRILYRENWGILAKSDEDVPGAEVRKGDKFWTKWSGNLAPLTRVPVVEVVNSVKT